MFIQSITEPKLIRIFLEFLCLEQFENHCIIHTLISRIGAKSKVCHSWFIFIFISYIYLYSFQIRYKSWWSSWPHHHDFNYLKSLMVKIMMIFNLSYFSFFPNKPSNQHTVVIDHANVVQNIVRSKLWRSSIWINFQVSAWSFLIS